MTKFDAKQGIIHYSQKLDADVAEDIIDRFGYPVLRNQLCSLLEDGNSEHTWSAITFICDGFSGNWSERTHLQFNRYVITEELITALSKCLCGNNHFSRTHAAHAFSKNGLLERQTFPT